MSVRSGPATSGPATLRPANSGMAVPVTAFDRYS